MKEETNDTDRSSIESDGDIKQQTVYASEEEGRQYRNTVYQDVEYDSLERAPETNSYPKTDGGSRFRLKDLPKVPKLSHVIGPGAIMLGAGIGSGETMFWPLLIADAGWSLYWLFWIGVLTQFFINTELQRWTMATGESIFRGFSRLNGFWPWFFLVAGFFHIGWPGWAATGAEVFVVWTGIVPQQKWWIIGIILIALIWLSYLVGPLMYNLIENIQIGLIIVAIVLGVSLMFLVGSMGQLANVPAGAISFGSIPTDIGIATLLSGLAYAGGGGYVNLVQGIWAREKGYGMGTYQGRLKNPVRGPEDPEEIHEGFTFEPTEDNLKRWKGWWRLAQQEHFLTFVAGLLVVATVMMTIAAQYVPAQVNVSGGLSMWLSIVIPQFGGIAQFMIYALLFIALFTTQYALTDLFVRNSTDIIYEMYGRKNGWNISRLFFGILTLFSLWGIGIIGFQFQEPFILLVIGGAIAGLMMWPYNALTIILNVDRLPEHTQPGWGRIVAMWWATAFFGYFSVLLIADTLIQYFNLTVFRVSTIVMGSAPGGYALWLLFVVSLGYTIYQTSQAKINAKDSVDDADNATGFLA